MSTLDLVADVVTRHQNSNRPVPPGPRRAEERLEHELGLTSAAVVAILVDLEDEHGIVVPDDRLDGLHRLGDLVSIVDELATDLPARGVS